MRGLMMHPPLLISSLIQSADEKHGTTEIVTRTVEGPIHRYTYREAHARARRLANALLALGVKPGDRIATLAWNTHRHFELYYAVAGIGAICHTVNPRLFPPQIEYILNHAEDKYVFVDLTFVPMVAEILPRLLSVKGVVVMTDDAHISPTALPEALCYETLLAAASDEYEWPVFDELTASSLFYTSGTTGNPKGVLYSHRTTLLYAYTICMPDATAISARDCVLPVVPMFHVSAWGLPYAAALTGCKLVLPGASLDGPSLHKLIEAERVTMSAGVPTVWLALLAHLRATDKRVDSLDRLVIGGAAAPPAMIETFRDTYGVNVLHAWGMTEMSGIGTINRPKNTMAREAPDQRAAREVKQGRPVFSVRMKIVDDENQSLPHDGKALGELKVWGLSVCAGYFRDEASSVLDSDGWFATGDVATIDADGYLQITDRSKDVIRSGGEWISSIDLENVAVGHPEVAEAAVIGVRHPRWDERPLLLVVRHPGSQIGRAELLAWYDGKVAKWWIPDDIVFVADLPHTATGKLSKTKLRADFKDHRVPNAAGRDRAEPQDQSR